MYIRGVLSGMAKAKETRDAALYIRLKPSELASIQRQAEKAGKSVSEWVRTRLLEAANKGKA